MYNENQLYKMDDDSDFKVCSKFLKQYHGKMA